MIEHNQKQLGKVFCGIPGLLCGAMNADDFRDVHPFSLSPGGERYSRAEVFQSMGMGNWTAFAHPGSRSSAAVIFSRLSYGNPAGHSSQGLCRDV